MMIAVPFNICFPMLSIALRGHLSRARWALQHTNLSKKCGPGVASSPRIPGPVQVRPPVPLVPTAPDDPWMSCRAARTSVLGSTTKHVIERIRNIIKHKEGLSLCMSLSFKQSDGVHGLSSDFLGRIRAIFV